MERIKDLTVSYHHSEANYIEQQRIVYVLTKELERITKNASSTEDKLRILAMKDEIRVSEIVVEDRAVELADSTAELLEGLKDANIEIDEVATFHLHDITYIDVHRTGDDSIVIFGPYSKTG
jgi:putative heme iron utilization protein